MTDNSEKRIERLERQNGKLLDIVLKLMEADIAAIDILNTAVGDKDNLDEVLDNFKKTHICIEELVRDYYAQT